MNYDDENRGAIQFRKRAKQIIDFRGIRYGNITPTDIDGFFEKADQGFVFYEYKLDGCEMPRGQKVALERIVNALHAAGKKSILFLCKHDKVDPEQDIIAADTIVDELYFRGRYYQGEGQTAKQWTDRFIGWLEIENAKPAE